ncbi:hypothetical protein TNCT_223381 [Trichonephila clavata]|uniref:Uncharacterized protein n=1 Tax=Trichonephila clavata TaxID=2740835 RepID=A0A8X6KYE6_TRICU|nr:hypothetical protein TNCT_223381 [Trichonephila clavata]
MCLVHLYYVKRTVVITFISYKILIFSQCVVEGTLRPASESAGISMETYGVQSAVALEPLSLVYPTYELYLLKFIYFQKSLHDALPKQCSRKQLAVRITVYHKCHQFFQISLLNHAEIASYMGHVFGNGFDRKHASLSRYSFHFDSTVSPISRGLSQAKSFCRRVGAPD